jgi:hypothetical protein
VILELRQAAETARVALETKMKQVEGESPLSLVCLSVEFIEIRVMPQVFSRSS